MRAVLPLLLSALLAIPGALAAAPRAEGTVSSFDGVPIAWEARGEGSPALVFVHCWACDRSLWRHQMEALAGEHRVVALDVAGHGDSGSGRERWTLESLARDVEAVVEALDLERVVLVGHSMGGPVSLLAVPRLRDRVEGLVCVDTLHDADFRWPEEQTGEWIAGFEADYERSMREAIGSLFPEDADPTVVAEVIEGALAAHRPAAVALLRAFPELDLPAALAEAGVPVRCINSKPWGPGGMPTAVETNRGYADFDAVLLDDVGHYPMLERPELLTERLREAVDEVAPRAGFTGPCSSAAHRQFDFWVGEWEVRDAEGELAGHNRIEKILDGCVLHESWRGAEGSRGESFNLYSERHGGWHQTWVDARGLLLRLDGGLEEGRMVLSGALPGGITGETLNEISWELLDDGRVEQHWRASRDGGESWQEIFLGFYSKVDS